MIVPVDVSVNATANGAGPLVGVAVKFASQKLDWMMRAKMR